MRDYVSLALRLRDDGTALPFATVDAKSDRVVGTTRFGNVEFWDWQGWSGPTQTDRPDAVEIGWTWLAQSAQRTPINTEAKLLMFTFAFETWNVHRVTLGTDARNAASRKAIERLGAHLDGVLRASRPAADGGVRDSARYSVLRDEWPAVRDRLNELLNRRIV
jgi:RimJ/RimL family protein N-acetyltransferase